ncbi:MAG: NUDIX hydrolase [Planctomycetota bacterium]
MPTARPNGAPAGRLHDDEIPAVGAARELLEETGYTAELLSPLPGFYPTGGISAHFAHPFIATGCVKVQEPQHEAAEQILVRLFTRGEVEALLDAGRVEDAFTALPLLYYLRWHKAE